MRVMAKSISVALLVVLLYFRMVVGYRPVLIMHGIADSYKSMEVMVTYIKDAHPGTPVYNIDAFNDADSFLKMWDQVDGVQKKISPIISNATDGVNLICYSQGGMVCRGFIEAFPDHNVKSFISLSSPQAGQFGDTDYFDFFLPNVTRDNVYRFCYSEVGEYVSFCDYWNDPLHQSEYEKCSDFLYPLNSGKQPDYKSNFMSVEELVLIGGPDDGVITPWQSSHFGFYDDKLDVQPYQSQGFYISDAFGLKTLDEEGRIHVYNISGVEHTHWHTNKTVFDLYIEPWLK
jgi:palmitoyl-protein thioesterase